MSAAPIVAVWSFTEPRFDTHHADLRLDVPVRALPPPRAEPLGVRYSVDVTYEGENFALTTTDLHRLYHDLQDWIRWLVSAGIEYTRHFHLAWTLAPRAAPPALRRVSADGDAWSTRASDRHGALAYYGDLALQGGYSCDFSYSVAHLGRNARGVPLYRDLGADGGWHCGRPAVGWRPGLRGKPESFHALLPADTPGARDNLQRIVGGFDRLFHGFAPLVAQPGEALGEFAAAFTEFAQRATRLAGK